MKSFLVAALALVPAVALAQGMTTGGSPADRANKDAMGKMSHDMPTGGTGDADKDFVTMMTPHHQGAIDMAKVELRYGRDPVLRRMAQDIIRSQEKEIAAMNRWKAKHP